MIRVDNELERLTNLLERALIKIVDLEGTIAGQDQQIRALVGSRAEVAEIGARVDGVLQRLSAVEQEVAGLDGGLVGLTVPAQSVKVSAAPIPANVPAGEARLTFVDELLRPFPEAWLGIKARQRRHYRTLSRSALFDREFYLRTYRDVAAAGADPVMHYIRFGSREKRQPSTMFNTERYSQRYPIAARDNPLAHHVRRCRHLLRTRKDLFDRAYYLQTNPDVREAGVDPINHFLNCGVFEGRAPRAGSSAVSTARALGWLSSGD